MSSLIIMVGVAGSGKDTWINETMKREDVSKSYHHHASDNIRMELYGYLKNDGNPQEVFDIMNKRTLKSLESGKNVFYNATNINRKRRAALYTGAKSMGHDVGIVYFMRPLQYLLDINTRREKHKKVPVEVIERMYKNIQPPRIEVDCDTFFIVGHPYFQEKAHEVVMSGLSSLVEATVCPHIKEELMLNYQPHDTPYHLESINEHIDMTIENSETPNMKLVALFHDLGKGICKENGTYYGHENVSANYMLNLLWYANITTYDLVEMVFQHMNAHQEGGLGRRVISRNQIDIHLAEAIRRFAEIDSKSRVLEG